MAALASGQLLVGFQLKFLDCQQCLCFIHNLMAPMSQTLITSRVSHEPVWQIYASRIKEHVWNLKLMKPFVSEWLMSFNQHLRKRNFSRSSLINKLKMETWVFFCSYKKGLGMILLRYVTAQMDCLRNVCNAVARWWDYVFTIMRFLILVSLWEF